MIIMTYWPNDHTDAGERHGSSDNGYQKFLVVFTVHALMELMDPDNIPRRVSAQRHEEEFDIAVHGKLVLCNYHWVTRPRGFGFPSNGDLVAIGDCQMHLRWSIDSCRRRARDK